jgi:hypothetical protein
MTPYTTATRPAMNILLVIQKNQHSPYEADVPAFGISG